MDHRLAKRLLLAGCGMVLAVIAAEVALRALGLPRTYLRHSEPEQFLFVGAGTTNAFYVNRPSSRIRFVYDGNPRGYFGLENEIDHEVNGAGFRALTEYKVDKPEHTLRVAFLGDSFTFGEGVRFQDTYPEAAAAALRQAAGAGRVLFECPNFGVGGYNTAQELQLLRQIVLPLQPDAVVLGVTLSDAEPPLFTVDPRDGQPVRRPQEAAAVPEGEDAAQPPNLLFGSRVARAVWLGAHRRETARRTIAYYRALYGQGSPGWQTNREAMRQFVATCGDQGIPCVVILFPVLLDLGDRYPFQKIHDAIAANLTGLPVAFVDLLPLLRGRNAAALWVHPTDQHPNEIVHGIAGKAAAAALMKDKVFQQHMAACRASGGR